MPVFTYKAKKDPKKIIVGEIEAEDINSAVGKLKNIGLFPFFIEKKGTDTLQSSSFLFFKNISSQDINIFTRQLSDLIHSGLPLAKALNTLSKQTTNKQLRSIIEDVEGRIRKGEAFYEALKKHPKVFSPFFINLIRAGEASGILDETLGRMSEIREREQDFRNQMRSSLTYPALLVIVSVSIVFILVTFVIPKFVEIFEELGHALPLPTTILLNISNVASRFWPVIVTAAVVFIVGLRRYLSTEKGALVMDKVRLRIPLLGEVFRQVEISRFTRILGTLLKNGVPILESLRVTSETVENKIFVKEAERFLEGIEKGKKLSDLMRENRIFPPSVTDLVAIGEESARFEEILLNISESFEKESQTRIKMFMAILEPSLILLLGLVVLFIVFSMLLPIFDISTLLK